jgi:hypothetical protein
MGLFLNNVAQIRQGDFLVEHQGIRGFIRDSFVEIASVNEA